MLDVMGVVVEVVSGKNRIVGFCTNSSKDDALVAA